MKAGKTSWLAAAAVAVAIFSLAAAPAAGKHHKHHKKALPRPPATFFGVVGDATNPSDLVRMKAAGVDTIRLLLYWAAAENTPGTYDWSTYDNLIGNVASAGLIPHVQFAASPAWISSNQNRPPIYSDLQKTAWTNFLTAFTQRYGRGGAFWRDHPGLPYEPVVSFEIWNEANLNREWGGPPNPDDYYTLLELSAGAINQVDPAATIIIGGLFPFPSPSFGMGAKGFLRGLYAHPGARGLVDALALHPFTPRVADLVPTALIFRKLLGKLGSPRTPLWITELGWSTSGQGWATNGLHATEPQQAAKLTRSFTALIRARKTLRLQRLFWHNWRDSPDPNTDSLFQMGLLRADGSAKPSWGAYRRLARR
jgi:hypothetical protein